MFANFFFRKDNGICFGIEDNRAKTTKVTMLSRKSTKQNSPSIVLKTVEEHIPDSSREQNITLHYTSFEETKTEEEQPKETI